ncbi:S10 family serine carboxypeptidase-like protein [Novosphingobium pokkalii]|uniref:Peptidase S10 n=2 Tax=Novosphingobium pokkalii TaxID=1770194 RepID=A0ABV7V2K4_9SPHN|nr:peptidase S10 [Novosphingobium pokkalii]GHC83865.1 carboxypeptidase [Novosphingobium pokkalii]
MNRSALALAPLLLAAAPPLAPEPAQDGPIAPATSHHAMATPAGRLDYDAVFEQQVLSGADGQPAATMSTIAYLRSGTADAARPVIFAFNGGPGASSSPLHIEAMGPRRRDATGLVDNVETPLDRADLVFVDPVGTGFSRPLTPSGGAPFWSVAGDARAMAQAITGWLAAHARAHAPVIVVGESYGGTRAAAMLPLLKQVNLAGLVLLSPALVIGPQGDSELVEALPATAVAAAAHGRGALAGLPPAQVEARAAAFAAGPYARALLAGSALAPAEQARVAAQMARLIGLPPATIRAARLRVDVEMFRAALLADQGKVVGRLDSRVAAPRPAPVAGRPSAASDPALGLGASNVIVSAALGDYLRRELGVQTARDYVALTLDVNFQWRWPRVEGAGGDEADRLPDLLGNLAQAMVDHPALEVTLVGGYYDMAVPLMATRDALRHAWLPPSRARLVALPAGHSVFADAPGRRAMRAIIDQLLRANANHQANPTTSQPPTRR